MRWPGPTRAPRRTTPGTGPNDRRPALLADLVAGASVAVILIPQSVAYAQLAGVPATAALPAAAAAALGGAILASSPYLQTGPTALTALLTFGALGVLAGTGEIALEHAMLLALAIGVIRVVLGLLRGGALAFFVSEPMLVGLLPGAAITIAATQIPALLGVSDPSGSGIFGRAWETLVHPGSWDGQAVGLSLGALAAMLLGKRIGLGLASVPLVVAAAVVWSEATGYDGATVGALEAGAPVSPLGLPWGDLDDLILPALIIAVVGFVEPTAIGRTMLERERRWDADRELLSQGVANVASGFAGGFPVSGSFSRSALNREAGARTRLSGAISGALVLVFLPAANVLSDLPTAIPAAIVIGAIATLVSPAPLLRLARSSRIQFGVALATLVLTLVLAPRIDQAIAIGIALAVGVHLWREMRVPIAASEDAGTLHLRPAGVLWFGSAARFEDEVERLIEQHTGVRRLVIHLDGLGRVDVTGARSLSRVLDDARRRGVEASIEGIPPVTGGMISRVLAGREPDRDSRT